MTSMLGSGLQAAPVIPSSGHAEHSLSDGETEMEKIPLWERLRKFADVGSPEDFGVPDDALRAFKLAAGQFILDRHADVFEERNDPDNFAFIVCSRPSELCSLYNGELVKSPIEGQLAAALLWMDCDWAGFPTINEYFDLDAHEPTAECPRACLTPQAAILSYKVDLLLWFRCRNKIGGIAIECDGHAFHEKTREQAARDKKRDRDLLSVGFPVMRFSGSEIFNNPCGCAEQVQRVACDILFRVSKDGGLF